MAINFAKLVRDQKTTVEFIALNHDNYYNTDSKGGAIWTSEVRIPLTVTSYVQM